MVCYMKCINLKLKFWKHMEVYLKCMWYEYIQVKTYLYFSSDTLNL